MPKLVNLGSLCIDNVYRVANIAAAGETVASLSYDIYAGGKGLNQSLAAAKAGAQVVHVGAVGLDGVWLRDTLEDGGVDASGVRVEDGTSGHAVIQVDESGTNAIVVSGGTNRALTPADVEGALGQVEAGDWLLLQNEINDLDVVLARAKAKGCNVSFNVAPVDGREAHYELDGVALLVVNEVEAAALAGVAEPKAAVEALRQRYPKTEVVLTLGADGLMYAGRDGATALPAFKVKAVDETAAGDSFIGYLMAALLAGEPMAQALRLGSAAGALAVGQAGAATSIPERNDVQALAKRGK